MNFGPGDAIVRRDEIGRVDRFVRVALAVYLAPVILAVLSIGLIGMLAAKLVRPAARVAAEGAHSSHKPSRPLGLGKAAATRARELV